MAENRSSDERAEDRISAEVVQRLPDLSNETALERMTHAPVISLIDNATLQLIASQVAQNCNRAEIGYFLELCARYDLDPFAREAWAAKGRGDDSRLLVMVGRDGLRKIAQRNGLEIDGDVIRQRDEFRVVRNEHRERTVYHAYNESYVEGEEAPTDSRRGPIVGAWAEVWDPQTGRQKGFFLAYQKEYKPTNPNKLRFSPWGSQESVMALAAAERQATRQATPLSGLLVSGEELLIADRNLSAGDGNGEARGIKLPDEVEDVLREAIRVGHVGIASRTAAEVAVGGSTGPEVVAQWVGDKRRQLAEFAERNPPPEAEVIESDVPIDTEGLS